RAPDRALVNVDDLVEMLDTVEALVGAGPLSRAVELLRQCAVERVEHQRRLARTRHAGDADKNAERERHGQIAQVVLARAAQGEPAPAQRTSPGRDRNIQLAP